MRSSGKENIEDIQGSGQQNGRHPGMQGDFIRIERAITEEDEEGQNNNEEKKVLPIIRPTPAAPAKTKSELREEAMKLLEKEKRVKVGVSSSSF